jgi:hypothetical protein
LAEEAGRHVLLNEKMAHAALPGSADMMYTERHQQRHWQAAEGGPGQE